MQALLVRIGVDQTFGGWNAPVDVENRFVYVPIPEKAGTEFHPGLERRFHEVVPALRRFCRRHARDLGSDLRFPRRLLRRAMHLDPDFDHLTYGDVGSRRGARLVSMVSGDFLVFYGGLRPIHESPQRLVYALLGIYFVKEVVAAMDVPPARRGENAHTRRLHPGVTDVVVHAQPAVSGRFDQCIPIGEWRDGAYRVRQGLLHAWGGLSVKDGYVQRSAVPPLLRNPERFLRWLEKQGVRVVASNNWR